jgi:penicillin-binding protein 1A
MGYLILIAGLIGSLFIYTCVRDLPSVEDMLKRGISPTHYAQVFGSDGSVILSYGKFRHHQVKLKEVSPHFIQALLATEDRRFYDHHGVDPMSLIRAIGRDIVHRKLLEGGSTLTQQLARNVFLSNERSFRRKIREAILAVELENHLSKKQILELYVNNIYFGEGAYGIAAASEIYFGKTPAQLTVDEAAMLAGMPQAPTNYSPFRNPKLAERRRNEVLVNMSEWGKLTTAQISVYKQRAFHLNKAGLALGSGDKAPFFNRFVLKQIQSQFDLDEQSFWQSGLKIYTTLNPRAQSLAARHVQELSLAMGRNKPNQQAALLSIDPKTGGILAYVGGTSYEQTQFDRVSQATRSPGSLFKVFTYTAAIDKGIDPYRQFLDEPIYFGGWHPENFDRQHHGVMPLYRAFYTSNNVIAVKLLKELTPGLVIDLARRMGMNGVLDDNLALTLGGSGVKLLDITAAFSVLANQGVRNEPYAIDRIVDAQGQEIYHHKPLPNQVLKRTTTDTMVSMMQNVITRGTARNADFGHPAAGKTGTSDDHRDAWFIGFTPNVITGVWVGNDDNTTMPGMVGGSLPASIWRNFMQGFLANKMQTPFDVTYSRLLARNRKTQNITDDGVVEDAPVSESPDENTPAPETYENPPGGENYFPPEVKDTPEADPKRVNPANGNDPEGLPAQHDGRHGTNGEDLPTGKPVGSLPPLGSAGRGYKGPEDEQDSSASGGVTDKPHMVVPKPPGFRRRWQRPSNLPPVTEPEDTAPVPE